MKLKVIIYALAGLGLTAVVPQSVLAAPKEKPGADVESRLTEVIKAAYPDVVISGMAKETEDGLHFVAIQFTSKGHKIDADVMEDGTFVGTEEVADVETFPKPAADALKAATKGLKVVAYEIAKTYAVAAKGDTTGLQTVKLDKPTIAFEADVQKIQSGEFAISADGTVLESPAWVQKVEVKAGTKD